MGNISRRGFLRASAVLGLGATRHSSAWSADPPSERVRLAIMGVNGRGRELAKLFLRQPRVEIATLIEPDANLVPRALKELKPLQAAEPRVESDVRKALEDPTITALVVAAPDHWHALATIWACQAGKHVYVEKPVSHNLVEGRKMVEAARKYNRVVQVGVQRRSGPHFRSAAEFIRSGRLGKVPLARAAIGGNRASIGHKPDGPTPPGVDYNLWTGPAPLHPFNPNRFHYEWHWHWDYGTGELGNNGIHGLDALRMLLNLDAPVRVTSGGGKHFYDDDRQTPDTQIATFDFPGTTLVWEHRLWAPKPADGESFSLVILGEKGTMKFDRKGWHIEDGPEASDRSMDVIDPHLKNFLECVRTGARPNADIEEGHKSTRLCHLGNIAYRLGRSVQFDARNETILQDEEANRMLRRAYREPFVVPATV